MSNRDREPDMLAVRLMIAGGVRISEDRLNRAREFLSEVEDFAGIQFVDHAGGCTKPHNPEQYLGWVRLGTGKVKGTKAKVRSLWLVNRKDKGRRYLWI